MEIRSGEFTVAQRSPAQEAAKHPLGTEKLVEQLGRLGDSSFELGTLDNQLEGNCHIAVSALNQLRRALVKQLEDAAAVKPERPKITTTYQDLLPGISKPEIQDPKLSVLCRTLGQVTAALDCGVETIYCDFEDPRRYKEAVALVRSGSK